MVSWIGITLIEVGGASACGGLEAEGQEFFSPCLSGAILKRSAPEPKGPLSQLLIPNIPTFHGSIGFHSRSELVFPLSQRSLDLDFFILTLTFDISLSTSNLFPTTALNNVHSGGSDQRPVPELQLAHPRRGSHCSRESLTNAAVLLGSGKTGEFRLDKSP